MLINTTEYIMKNNWKLIDVTGSPTTWGFWGPEMVINLLFTNFKIYFE